MIEDLPPGSHARPASADDLGSIIELHDEYWRRFGLEPEPIPEFLQWSWGLPYVDIERDTAVIVSEDRVQAFGQVMYDAGEPGPAHVHGTVRPSAWGRGLGAAVLDWLVAAHRGRGADQVRASVPAQDQRGHDLMSSRGFTQVRTSWDMARAISSDDEPVPLPAGVSIRAFRTGDDEHVLYEVAEAAFQDHWDHHPQSFEAYSAEMFEAEDWSPSLAFLAELEGRVVGEVVALEFAESGYIASVGVLRQARGNGIATALLHHAFAALAARGFEKVELSVDATNPTGAVDLYEAVGMHVIRESFTFSGPAA